MIVAGNDCDFVTGNAGWVAVMGLIGVCVPQPLDLPLGNGDEFAFLI